MFALRVEVNFFTGERAGGIDPTDPKFLSLPEWQNIADGVEIILILKHTEGDVDRFRAASGVEVIEGEDAIDQATLELNPRVASYAILSESLLAASIRQKEIDVTDLDSSLPPEEVLKKLQEKGALGIVRSEPPAPVKVNEVISLAEKRGRSS